MSELYIAHHGVEGMKWGQRNGPPYPLSRLGSNRMQQIRKKWKRNANEVPEHTETKEEYETRKQKALKSGSATEVLEFKGDLSNNELREVINRLDMEKRLSQISDEELGRGKKQSKHILSRVGNAAAKTVNTVAKAVKTIKEIGLLIAMLP